MVQTVISVTLSSGEQKIFLEKPLVLSRIFFRITALLPLTTNYTSKLSFDDPAFTSFFVLTGPTISFAAKGEEISQGDIWVRNDSQISIYYSVTEILV